MSFLEETRAGETPTTVPKSDETNRTTVDAVKLQTLNMEGDWPLPPGWEASFDNTTQRWYFINHNEKVTTWEDPRPAYYSSKEKGAESTNTARASSSSHNGEKKADNTNAYDFPELECDSPFAGNASKEDKTVREVSSTRESFIRELEAGGFIKTKKRESSKHKRQKKSSGSNDASEKRSHKSELTRKSEDEVQAAKSEKTRSSARSSHLSSNRKTSSSSKQSDLSPTGKTSPTAEEVKNPPSSSLSTAVKQETTVPGVLTEPANSLKISLTPMVKLPEFEKKVNDGWKIIDQIGGEFSRCNRIKAQGPNPALLGTRVQACGPNPSLARGPNPALVRGPAKLVRS